MYPELNMEEQQQDENNLEEGRRPHHEQYSQELLINLTKVLIQKLSAGGIKAPLEGFPADGVDDRLDQLRILSQAWDRLAQKRKINDDEGLWNRLLDVCRKAEVETLRRQGHDKKSASKLVWVENAWWDPDSRQLLIGSAPPEPLSSFQVVVVRSDEGFRIHDEILSRLWLHPVLSKELSRNSACSPHDEFNNTLESVDVIARDYGYGECGYFPSLDEEEVLDRLVVDCIFNVLELTYLLETNDHGGEGVFEDVAPTKSENLAWLGKAKKGERLWRLLNAAVKLGQSLNHYSAFREANIEEDIRSMHPAYLGRETTPAGQAIERIISAAQESGLTKITPGELLKWLLGKKDPISDAKPLKVEHPLWGEELKNISWEKFENLVKSAKRR